MGIKLIRTYKRRIAKKIKRAPLVPTILLGVLLAFVLMMNYNRQLSVVPASYRPLLDLIARVESRGNYNAYYGNAHNTSTDFTKMTIAEVMEWQKQQVAAGSISTAVGRYQIIDVTLGELVRSMHIDTSRLFDKGTQDQIAIALLERRGSVKYVNSEITKNEFAANLAMEWASLPKIVGDNPEQSFYAGDGINASLVGTEEVLGVIDLIESEK